MIQTYSMTGLGITAVDQVALQKKRTIVNVSLMSTAILGLGVLWYTSKHRSKR